MKTNFVLVDFENVQPSNMGLLKGGPFRIKVFLGASQGKISLEMAQALQTFGDNAEYIQVVGSGKDALDFHIAYYIGRLSAEHPEASFSIISRDTGFDPLIKHLKARHIDCKRWASVAEIPGVKAPAQPAAAPAKETRRAAPAQRSPARSAPRAASAAQPANAAQPARTGQPASDAAPESTAPPAAPKAKATRKRGRAKPVPVPAVIPAPPPVVAPGRLAAVLENLSKRKRALPGNMKTLRSTIQSLFKPALGDDELEAILADLARQGKIIVTDKKVSYRLA